MKTDAPVQCSGAFLLLSGLCRPGLNKIRTLPCKSKAKSNELKILRKKQGEGWDLVHTRFRPLEQVEKYSKNLWTNALVLSV
jgi:hypothetical protein